MGRPVINGIIQERQERGPFTNLKDFITRSAEQELNKRIIENFIKAGALDSLGGTRKQFMSVYVQILDRITKDKKNNLAGQISLFDIADESLKEEFDIRMPNVGEYTKDMLLAFEKEVLGIYLSGHPLEAYEELWRKHITQTTGDFALDEESGAVRVRDQATVVVGGMIADKTVKYTKNDKVMSFLNLEDLVGNVEVVVFPGEYERYGPLLTEDAKIFVRGRVNLEEDKDGKLICEQIVSFEEAAQTTEGSIFPDRYGKGPGRGGWGRSSRSGYTGGGFGKPGSGNTAPPGNASGNKMPDGMWIQFPDADSYFAREKELLGAIADSDGNDDVVIFLKSTRGIKVLPPNLRVRAGEELRRKLAEAFGEENVKIRGISGSAY